MEEQEEEKSRMTSGSWPGWWVVGQGNMYPALRRKTREALTLKEWHRKQSPETTDEDWAERKEENKWGSAQVSKRSGSWEFKSDTHQEFPSNRVLTEYLNPGLDI